MDVDALQEQLRSLRVVQRVQSKPLETLQAIVDGSDHALAEFDEKTLPLVMNLQLRRFSPESRRRVDAEIAALEAQLARETDGQ